MLACRGMGISKNKKKGEGSWSEALSALQDLPQEFQDSMTMITDGDSSIISTLRNMVSDRTKVLHQRCIWHLFRELKYALWKDKANERTRDKNRRKLGWTALWRILEICLRVKDAVSKKVSTRKQYISNAYKDIKHLATWCMVHGLEHASILLTRLHMERGFAGAANGVKHVTTSLQERMMGTLNKRINVGGRWSERGALNNAAIRLAGYYNGWQPSIMSDDGQENMVAYSVA